MVTGVKGVWHVRLRGKAGCELWGNMVKGG